MYFRGFFDVQFSSREDDDTPKSPLLKHCDGDEGDEQIFKLFGTLATLNESFCSNEAGSHNKSPHTVFRLDFRLEFVVSQKKIDSLVSKKWEKRKISQITQSEWDSNFLVQSSFNSNGHSTGVEIE